MITRQLLQQYFDGHCTEQEQKIIITWLKDDTQDHSLLQNMMEQQWEEQKEEADGEILKDKLLLELRKKLYPVQTGGAVVRSIPSRRRIFVSVAASIAALLLLGVWFWNTTGKQQIPSSIASAAQWDSIANTSAGKQLITLADDTRIWLSPGSSLKYAVGKFNKERIVRLEGQAFFDVAHHASSVFKVYTGNIETRVLGTAFNIEAYESEKNIRVSLVRGRVAVHKQVAQPPLTQLQAGEILTYTKADSTAVKGVLKLTDMSNWTSQRIVFNDVRVQDALERLALQYHLTMEYEKGVRLEDKRFSTVFNHETLEQMIQNILFITDHNYRLQGKKLIITQ